MLTPASSPERALETSAKISLAVSTLVLLIKFSGYFLTHSESVLSDAVESVVNVVAALGALLVMRAVAEPADEDHPYGHGKLEFFSATFEGGLIAFAGIAIVYSGIQSFWRPPSLHSLEIGVFTLILSSLVNAGLTWYLFKVSREHQSQALRASALHVRSDIISTTGVIVGLGVVWLTHWQWVDNMIAVTVGLFLLREGTLIIRSAAGALIDESDEDLIESLAVALEKNRKPGLIDIHKVRVIRSGRFHHVDAHLVMPEMWSTREAHQLAQAFEDAVMQDYGSQGEIAFHIDPCNAEFCSICDWDLCPIRKSPLQSRRPFEAKFLTQGARPSE